MFDNLTNLVNRLQNYMSKMTVNNTAEEILMLCTPATLIKVLKY